MPVIAGPLSSMGRVPPSSAALRLPTLSAAITVKASGVSEPPSCTVPGTEKLKTLPSGVSGVLLETVAAFDIRRVTEPAPEPLTPSSTVTVTGTVPARA